DPASILNSTPAPADSGNYTTLGTEGTGVVGAAGYTSTATSVPPFNDVFVNTALGDFHIPPGSFAVDKGINSYIVGGLQLVPATGRRPCPRAHTRRPRRARRGPRPCTRRGRRRRPPRRSRRRRRRRIRRPIPRRTRRRTLPRTPRLTRRRTRRRRRIRRRTLR